MMAAIEAGAKRESNGESKAEWQTERRRDGETGGGREAMEWEREGGRERE